MTLKRFYIGILLLLIAILPIVGIAYSQTTLYLRVQSGPDCPLAGMDRTFGTTEGNALNAFAIGAIPNISWQRAESAGTIPAGEWQVKAWISVSNNGPQTTDVTARIRLRNPDCSSNIEFILTDTVTLNKGSLAEVTFSENVGEINVSEGDILILTFADTDGKSKPIATLRFNDDALSQANSRIIIP